MFDQFFPRFVDCLIARLIASAGSTIITSAGGSIIHLSSDYRENSGSYSLLSTVLCPPQALLANVRRAPGRYPFMISIVFVYFASETCRIRLLAAIVKNLLRLL